MSKRGSRGRFIQVICTDMYINPQTGIRGARHQQFRLGKLPVFVENDQHGKALRGTEYVGHPPDEYLNPRTPAHRCPKCGRALPGAARHSVDGKAWRRIVRQWLATDPKRSVLVVDISDPAYSW